MILSLHGTHCCDFWCLFEVYFESKWSYHNKLILNQTKKFFLATLVSVPSCIEESNSFQFGTVLLYESSESFFSQFSSLLDGIMFFATRVLSSPCRQKLFKIMLHKQPAFYFDGFQLHFFMIVVNYQWDLHLYLTANY